jgi:TolB protein
MKYLPAVLLLMLCVNCADGKKKTTPELQKKRDYKIAYNVLSDTSIDNYDVFVMDMDGKNSKNITPFDGVEWTYYAAGRDLYVISDKDTTHRIYFLYRTDAEGSKYEKVSNFRLADSWIGSRYDGQELIVRPHKTVDTAFYIIGRKGNILKRLKPELAYMNDANFSPDGSLIVFRGAEKPFKKDNGYIDELYMMNDDGSDLRQLTHYPIGDTTAKWYSYHAGPPMWHPTENFISYNSKQGGKSSLFAISPDGTGKRELFPQDSLQQGWHRWSPDGKWLAIEVFDKDGSQFHIQMVNWNTKEATILTGTEYRFQQAPVFVEVD